MTPKEVRRKIGAVSYRKGVYTFKRSYFAPIPTTGEKYWNTIKSKLPQARLIEYGSRFLYSDGAKVWVKFTVDNGSAESLVF